MEDHHGARCRRRFEQIDQVAAHAGARVVAVDEHEVHRPALGGKPLEQRRKQLVAVADVECDVIGLRGRAANHVDRMNLLAVGGDPRQAAALGGADLEREARLHLGEDALERGPLAERHLPGLDLEDRRLGAQASTSASRLGSPRSGASRPSPASWRRTAARGRRACRARRTRTRRPGVPADPLERGAADQRRRADVVGLGEAPGSQAELVEEAIRAVIANSLDDSVRKRGLGIPSERRAQPVDPVRQQPVVGGFIGERGVVAAGPGDGRAEARRGRDPCRPGRRAAGRRSRRGRRTSGRPGSRCHHQPPRSIRSAPSATVESSASTRPDTSRPRTITEIGRRGSPQASVCRRIMASPAVG